MLKLACHSAANIACLKQNNFHWHLRSCPGAGHSVKNRLCFKTRLPLKKTESKVILYIIKHLRTQPGYPTVTPGIPGTTQGISSIYRNIGLFLST